MRNCPFCCKAAMLVSTLPCKDFVCKVYHTMMEQIQNFTFSEVAAFKLMLVSFGILVGSAFSDFCKKHRWLFICTFLISLGLFLYNTYRLMEADDWD